MRSRLREESHHAVEVLQRKVGGWHPVEWLCELIGTFCLIFFGFTAAAILQSPLSPVNQAVQSTGVRLILLGASFGVIAATIAFSPIGRRSGAHLNPAITLGFWVRGHTHTHDLIGYSLSQLAGAVLAAAAFAAALGEWAASVAFVRTTPQGTLSEWSALGIETAITFCLVLTIFLMVSSPRTARFTPPALGVVLGTLIALTAPYTGASLNPARTLGPDIVTATFPSLWVYIVGPLLGALLAVAAFDVVARGRRTLTAKLFHDASYRSVHATYRLTRDAGRAVRERVHKRT